MDGKQAVDTGNAEAAMVGVSAMDTETPMVGKERWEEICRLYHIEGMSLSQIARVTNLGRKMVRRCLPSAVFPRPIACRFMAPTLWGG